jgi:hypothetical protein
MSNYVAPGLLKKIIDQTVRTVSDIRSVVSLVNSSQYAKKFKNSEEKC